MKTYTMKSKPGTPEAEKEIKKLLKENAGFLKKSIFGKNNGFRNSEKIQIFAWYWCGNWIGSIKRKYTTLYKPV